MRPDICRTDLMWQVRKRSPATLIDLSPLGTVQASANRVGKLARAYICLYTYVQWWCIVLPSKSIWQVTAIRPTSHSEPPCIARGKNPWVNCQVHPKVSTMIIFRRICIPARRACCRLCGVARCRAAICPFWESLMNSSRMLLLLLFLLFSSSFHTLTG